MELLKFGKANAKTRRLKSIEGLGKWLGKGRKVYSLDLSAGVTCPGAHDCKCQAVQKPDGSWTIKDGPNCQFRCFSASQEAFYPSLRRLRQHNTALLKTARTKAAILRLLQASLPHDAGIIRLHVSGDFFSLSYLQAVVALAEANPHILFYSYTKSLHHLAKVDMENPCCGVIRPNFIITASWGGKHDKMIPVLGVRTCRVVYDESTPLPIDHDDSHAALPGGDYAILIHGIQPAGSYSSKALARLKRRGVVSTYKR